MLKWSIYYSDGTTFTSEDGAWEQAPNLDVQVVLFQDPDTGYAMRHGGDFFYLADDGSVVAMDLVGMIDHVCNALGIVKQGRMLTKAGWNEVYQRAKRDLAELKREQD